MTGKFDLEEISTLLGLLRDNDVKEFKLERGGDRLWLRRGEIPPAVVNYPMQSVQQAPAMMAAPLVAAHSADTSGHAATATAPSVVVPVAAPVLPARTVHELKSPMVGTFYRRPAPDAKPFVDVGDKVRKGQVLCIVEAMKLMNEIECDKDGTVVELCLTDGQMAEYGEVLFRIDVG
ncbi:MAG: acetyl-CoA carboxylase biotin carboxyl carrier protein [Deltaproteobacteria bacterium]|nr:acetyl-CoA carboxylase biotin carboxyl carrier protein [Deltaproteobacteria bacterium]